MFTSAPQAGLVRLILPTPNQTTFLRACLLPGEAGREAWNDCVQQARDPAALSVDRWGIGVFAALLFAAVKRNHLPLGKAGMTYLRTAYLNEKLRWESFCGIVTDVVEVLGSHRIEVVLRGEAALARTVYDDPILRHAHRVDLVVHKGERDRAAKALRSVGFLPSRRRDATPGSLLFRHRSGLPLGLYGDRNEWDGSVFDVWARCRPHETNETSARILSPADSLVHACLSASPGTDGESLFWVADAWNLLVQCSDLDWGVVLGYAKDEKWVFPLSVTLKYLEHDLGAPVPSGCLRSLDAAAAAAEGSEVKRKLRRILAQKRVDWPLLTHMTGDWRVRAFVLWCNLVPSSGSPGKSPTWPRPWNLPITLYRVAGYLVWYVRMRLRGYKDARILERYLFVVQDPHHPC